MWVLRLARAPSRKAVTFLAAAGLKWDSRLFVPLPEEKRSWRLLWPEKSLRVRGGRGRARRGRAQSPTPASSEERDSGQHRHGPRHLRCGGGARGRGGLSWGAGPERYCRGGGSEPVEKVVAARRRTEGPRRGPRASWSARPVGAGGSRPTSLRRCGPTSRRSLR